MRSIRGWFLLLLFLPAGAGVAGGRLQAQESDGPTKAALVDVLKQVLPLLTEGKLDAASAFFMQPAGFEPKMLAGMVKNREISLPGIRQLEQNATFGTGIQVFGQERAEYFAGRFQVDPASCYGFQYESDGVTAEVLALWNGRSFQLMRLDDVGKLPGPSAAKDSPAVDPAADKPEMKSESAQSGTAAPQASLPELAAAVESMPTDVAARSRYAMALFGVGNFPEAWKQLIAAYQVQPDHVGVSRGIKAVFIQFEKLGAFTVGVPPETVSGLLGDPLQEIEMGDHGRRFVYGFMAIDFRDDRLQRTIDLRGVDESLFQPTEIVDVELPVGWQCGLRRLQKNSNTAVYFPPGQSIQQWTEKFEVERIQGVAERPLSEIGELMMSQIRVRQPEATGEVVRASDDSSIIAVKAPSLNAGESEFRLIRFMKGPVDLHRIEFSVKADALSDEQKSWMKLVQAASLTPVDRPVESVK